MSSINIVDYQQYVSAPLKLIPRLDHVHRPHRFELPNDGLILSTSQEQLLSLMNWIALFFARKPSDFVCASLTENNQNLTLHVSLGSGLWTEEVRDAGNAFKGVLKTIIQMRQTNRGEHVFEDEYAKVMETVASTCWGKIVSRIGKLQKVIEELGISPRGVGRLEGLIKDWSDSSPSHADEANPSPQSTIRSLAQEILHFPKDAQGTDSKQATSNMIVWLKSAFTKCQSVLQLDFIREAMVKYEFGWVGSIPIKKADELLCLEELFVRTQALLEYHSGTVVLLNWGIQNVLCRRNLPNLQQFDMHFKIEWVPDLPVIDVKWSKSSRDYLLGFIRTNASFYGYNEKSTKQTAILDKVVKDVWNKDDTIHGTIHPEVQMAYFIQEKGLKPIEDVIGVSGPLCFACGAYFNGMGRNKGKKWCIREWDNDKFVSDWHCPPMDDRHAVGKLMWAKGALGVTVTGLTARMSMNIERTLLQK